MMVKNKYFLTVSSTENARNLFEVRDFNSFPGSPICPIWITQSGDWTRNRSDSLRKIDGSPCTSSIESRYPSKISLFGALPFLSLAVSWELLD